MRMLIKDFQKIASWFGHNSIEIEEMIDHKIKTGEIFIHTKTEMEMI